MEKQHRLAFRYRPRHLVPRPRRRGPAVVGTATAVWLGSAAPSYAGIHVVRPGETLSAIAGRYKTSATRLVRMNDLRDPDLIVAGARLRVPGGAGGPRIHVVRAGETLSGIAARYKTSVARIARANRLADPDLIAVGRRLRIPGPSGVVYRSAAPPARAGSVAASLERQSRSHGVDTSLVKAVAWLESGWKQRSVSGAGAIGVMQVMPDTARYVNRHLGGGRLRIRRMDDNVHLGVMYLRHMLGMMRSESRALAAYFSGPGNVRGRLDDRQRWYARTVQALRGRFR